MPTPSETTQVISHPCPVFAPASVPQASLNWKHGMQQGSNSMQKKSRIWGTEKFWLPEYQFKAQQHGFQSSNLFPEFSDQFYICILKHKELGFTKTDIRQQTSSKMLHRTSLEKVVYSFGVTSEAVFSKYGPRTTSTPPKNLIEMRILLSHPPTTYQIRNSSGLGPSCGLTNSLGGDSDIHSSMRIAALEQEVDSNTSAGTCVGNRYSSCCNVTKLSTYLIILLFFF